MTCANAHRRRARTPLPSAATIVRQTGPGSDLPACANITVSNTSGIAVAGSTTVDLSNSGLQAQGVSSVLQAPARIFANCCEYPRMATARIATPLPPDAAFG